MAGWKRAVKAAATILAKNPNYYREIGRRVDRGQEGNKVLRSIRRQLGFAAESANADFLG